MSDFLTRSRLERADLLEQASQHLHRSVTVLEKDLWVCWALEALFKLELPMVFKGGTSLSKVYRAISRFSEDLDITIDHRSSADAITDPTAASVSNTKRREFSERMKLYTQDTVQNLILPHLEQACAGLPLRLETHEDGDQLLLLYTPLTENAYVLPQIKLEFGSRNAIEPSQVHHIKPDILEWDLMQQWQAEQKITFPQPHIPVLLAERTFWEKVTLIHAEITRKNAKATVERYSRHWYDLAQLAGHAVGKQALKRFDLRDHVILTKTALFGVSGVNYSLVSQGGSRLIPTGDLDQALEQDYREMQVSGMFDGTPPTWQQVLEVLGKLEQAINQGV
jgi:hypothetical protein